ncbi:MAG: helix-turn-helix transcriptional regulator [Oscillospiraceae bacterium]|nr:helix-turn-helix transcriptional regulator [Oscillospiraceae bacterium]
MQFDENALRKTIGKNIALYRKANRDTQAALGEKLNYTDKAVSKWERGESIPDVYVLSCIAQLYGITVGTLIGETKPEIRTSPHLHLYIYLLSAALVYVISTVLIVAFEIFNVPFNTWLFLLYGSAIVALLGVIFTMLWWNLWLQLGAWSALIWLSGLTIFLTVPGLIMAKVFLICVALQGVVVIWTFYRRSRRVPREARDDG